MYCRMEVHESGTAGTHALGTGRTGQASAFWQITPRLQEVGGISVSLWVSMFFCIRITPHLQLHLYYTRPDDDRLGTSYCGPAHLGR
jgi:hypothetical protein